MGHQKQIQAAAWVYFCKKGNRTREGFGVKKTVWYTVFSQKSLSGSESQTECKAEPLQMKIPLWVTKNKSRRQPGFIFAKKGIEPKALKEKRPKQLCALAFGCYSDVFFRCSYSLRHISGCVDMSNFLANKHSQFISSSKSASVKVYGSPRFQSIYRIQAFAPPVCGNGS